VHERALSIESLEQAQFVGRCNGDLPYLKVISLYSALLRRWKPCFFMGRVISQTQDTAPKAGVAKALKNLLNS